jgi:hypothetical protein
MPVSRCVTAAHVAALQALTEVHPGVPKLETFLATLDVFLASVSDRVQM